MFSARSVDRSAVAQEDPHASLCRFTFSDGRRCRSPRSDHRSHLCLYHARKEARSKAAEKLSREVSYFLSGDYLTACDLGTALGRLIPSVLRGDIKPRTAHTVAYLAQTLAQTIHLAQHEYINSFGTEGWRRTVRNSVNQNSEYRKPSPPDEPPQSLDQPQASASQPQPPNPQHEANHLHGAARLQSGSSVPAPPPSQPSAATREPVVAGLQSTSPVSTPTPPRTPTTPESPATSRARTRPSPPPSYNASNRASSSVPST